MTRKDDSFFSIFCFSLLFTLLAVILGSSQFVFSDPSIVFPDKELLPFYESTKIQQRFTATQPNLQEIRFLFDKSSLVVRGELFIRLRDEQCSAILAEDEVNILHIMDHRFAPLSFPTIQESKGRQFCIEIEYMKNPHSANEWVAAWRDGSEPFTNSAYIQDSSVVEDYSLVFRPRYRKDSLTEAFAALLERASQYKAPFFKGPYLYALTLVASTVSLGLVVLLLAWRNHRE